MSIVTLTSDLGDNSHYPAIINGVILSLFSDLQLIDVTHNIPSFDLMQAAYVIKHTYRLGVRVTLHRKDLPMALEAARILGLPRPMAAYAGRLESGLIAQGFGDEDMSAVARSVRDMGGI